MDAMVAVSEALPLLSRRAAARMARWLPARGLLRLLTTQTGVVLASLSFPIGAVALPPELAPVPGDVSSENARYDLVRYRERLELDGSSTSAQEIQVLLRTEAAVAAFGQISSTYLVGYGDVVFESVLIEKPDGRRVEVANGLVEDVNPFDASGTSAFAGVHYKKLTIPGLEPGDRLSYRILNRQEPLARGHLFGQMKFNPVVGDPVQTFELDLPRDARVRVRLREGLGAAWEEVPSAADRLVRRLSMKVEQPDRDPQKLTKAVMQSWTEPDVIFTSFSSWAEVGQWWWGLSRDRLKPDAAIKAEAARLVSSRATPRERIASLHAFAASKIRYLNVSFAAGRMQPLPAGEVFANRYGDCKDKHAVLAALASSVGLDVRPVFIDSYRADLIDEAPGPHQFDHMISVAMLGPEPADWLWLDATNPYGVPGYLVPGLRDKRALLVEPSGKGRIVRTPAEAPFVPRNEVELKGTLQPDGVLRARVALRFRSDHEVLLRAAWVVLPQDKRAEVVQKGMASSWQNSKVTNLSTSDPLDVAQPFRVEFDVERPAPAAAAKREWNLWVPIPDFELAATKPAMPGDAAIELGRREFIARVEIEIPEGVSIRAPLSVSLERPFGRFESTYSIEGRRLKLSRTMMLTRQSISPEEVSSYEAFRKTIDTDRDQEFLVLGGVTATAAPSAESLYAEGLAAFNQKDYLRAVELLRKATQLDAKVKNGFLELGRALSEAGRNEEALQAFSRQIENDSFHENAYAWRAYALERLDLSEEAEKDLLKQIEVAPFQAWSYQRLGERRTVQRRFREAADFFSRAAAIEPNGAGHWVDLAWAHARDGRADEARAALVRARSLDLPDWMRISAAGVYDLIREPGPAAELAEDGLASVAQRLAGLSADRIGESDLWGAEYVSRAWYLMGAGAAAAGHTEKAERYLDSAWKLWFLPEAAWALGNLREKQGRLAEAVTLWSMAASVPTAAWSLPADHKSRIEKGRVLAGQLPKIEAESQLTQLRTLTLQGPVLADLTEEVLVLARPDGGIERVRNLSRRNPGAFERQLATAGPIRLALASPDERPFKAVRRGLLACSRATSCAVILDLPGIARVDSARSAAARQWTAPEPPDPQEIRREADEDMRAGRFEVALEKYLWFHRNALKYRRSLSGVRLSFALNGWFRLGGVYPPALTALRDTRDESLETFKREHNDDAFADFVAINLKLGEEGRTVEAFVLLDKQDPPLAHRVFGRARPALIRAKEYVLCGRYLKPTEDLSQVLESYRMNREAERDERIGPDIARFTEDSFTNETTILIALLVVNGREQEAKDVASSARSAWVDPAFAAAIEKALQGVVPEPWP